MRVTVMAVGKLKDGPERELYARYSERIGATGKAVALGPLELVEIVESRAASRDLRIADEAARLLVKPREGGYRILLDERGKAVTSRSFAELLKSARDRGESNTTFLVGGPDGHGDEARAKANLVLSLGPMTLPHGLARIVLVEQIYRAITILSGHPYHRE